MSVKKFVESVKELLGLDDFKKKGKKKSLKILLKKLNNRKENLQTQIDNKKINKKIKKELLEELDIVNMQLKNGKKILKKLDL